MRIAMPIFQNRVSPVFDWAGRLLVIEMEGLCETSREELPISKTSPDASLDQLKALEVDTLICGGISLWMLPQLKARNIRVISWVAGEVEAVLNAFCEGRIPSEAFTMPGCCARRRRRRFKGRGPFNQRGKDPS